MIGCGKKSKFLEVAQVMIKHTVALFCLRYFAVRYLHEKKLTSSS